MFHFHVGDYVKIKTINGVLRPCTGNDHRYKITKARRFLWFKTYDLVCKDRNGNIIKQTGVPEKELAKWWETI